MSYNEPPPRSSQTVRKSKFYVDLPDKQYEFKVVVLGDAGVGKSSIVKRFVQGIYIDNLPPTVNFDFAARIVTLRDGTEVTLLFNDIMGQNAKSLNPCFIRKCAGAIFVYDMNRGYKAFDGLEIWRSKIDEVSEGAATILIGNKRDFLVDTNKFRDGTLEELAQSKCRQLRINGHYMVSAKTGENIETAINHLIQLMIENKNGSKKEEPRENETLDLSTNILTEERTRKRDKCKQC